MRKAWACSAAGSAPHSHCGGREFESLQVHQIEPPASAGVFIWWNQAAGNRTHQIKLPVAAWMPPTGRGHHHNVLKSPRLHQMKNPAQMGGVRKAGYSHNSLHCCGCSCSLSGHMIIWSRTDLQIGIYRKCDKKAKTVYWEKKIKKRIKSWF